MSGQDMRAEPYVYPPPTFHCYCCRPGTWGGQGLQGWQAGGRPPPRLVCCPLPSARPEWGQSPQGQEQRLQSLPAHHGKPRAQVSQKQPSRGDLKSPRPRQHFSFPILGPVRQAEGLSSDAYPSPRTSLHLLLSIFSSTGSPGPEGRERGLCLHAKWLKSVAGSCLLSSSLVFHFPCHQCLFTALSCA